MINWFRGGLAWALYWLGDLAYRSTDVVDTAIGANAYQRLMQWSDDLQGDSPHGPWGPAIDAPEEDAP